MAQLNRKAMEAALPFDIHAATDITGNGLAGHSWEMAKASNVSFHFWDAIPFLPHALEMAGVGCVPGGARANGRYLDDSLHIDGVLDSIATDMMLDPQTSGGLLFALPADQSDRLIQELTNAGVLDVGHVGRTLWSLGARLIRVALRPRTSEWPFAGSFSGKGKQLAWAGGGWKRLRRNERLAGSLRFRKRLIQMLHFEGDKGRHCHFLFDLESRKGSGEGRRFVVACSYCRSLGYDIRLWTALHLGYGTSRRTRGLVRGRTSVAHAAGLAGLINGCNDCQ